MFFCLLIDGLFYIGLLYAPPRCSEFLGDEKVALLEACRENWIKAFEWIASVVPGGLIEHKGGLTIVRTRLPSADFNIVFAFDRPKSLEDLSEEINRVFVSTGTPWELVTMPESSEDLRPIIHDMELVRFEVAPGMVLDPLPDSCPVLPNDLKIRRAVDLEEIHIFLRTGDAGFGAPPGSVDGFREGLVAATRNDSFRGGNYLGYLDGKPVATSLRFTTGEIAGIYFVSTLPEFRRRGFAQAMTWRAAVDGRREGCTASCLQASEMGRSVYERMGYRTIAEYQLWRGQSTSHE